MSTEEYFRTLGIDAPLDFRKDRSKPLAPFEMKLLPSPAPAAPPGSALDARGEQYVSRTKACVLKSQDKFDPKYHIIDETKE
jgi:hypothetical protein